MQPRAFIAGVGLVSALGSSVEATWQALLEGQCIRTHTRIHPAHAAGGSRVAGLAIQAAREALADARWGDSHRGDARRGDCSVDPDDAALIVATSKGPIEHWCPSPGSTSDKPSPAGECSFGLAALADELAEKIGLQNCRRLTISAACASGLIALARATMMVQMGEVSRVLVVAAEASVHPLFVGSFRRLGVLAGEGELCRPFDRTRSGFLMSEAAAAVCIERSDVAGRGEDRQARPRVAVDGFVLAAEATHLVAGDPTGRTLERVLTQLIRDRAPDLIHAHGTGTGRADETEIAAIDRALESVGLSQQPPVYSHKGALGHSLGAAGLVAAVINHQCHLHQRVPPNVNTRSPLASRQAIIASTTIDRPIRRSIACAAGFGGPAVGVGFSLVW